MNTTENNKMIALFMGLRQPINGYFKVKETDGLLTYKDRLLYHSDWNWLMNAVKKIDNVLYTMSVNYVADGDDTLDDFYKLELEGLYYSNNETKVSCDIEEAYKAVVKFVEWYNQIK